LTVPFNSTLGAGVRADIYLSDPMGTLLLSQDQLSQFDGIVVLLVMS
jgi:hypothetical protein